MNMIEKASQSRRKLGVPKLQEKLHSKLMLVPGLVTVLAMTMGIHAIRFLFNKNFDAAAICVAIAGVLDLLDGKLARFLKVDSKFGSTLDTLADFLNFGIVPAFGIYLRYSFAAHLKIYWLAVVLYIVCMALRLARFAVIGVEGKFFKGVPAPGAAFLLTFPVCCEYAHYNIPLAFLAYISFFMLIATSFLMISSFQTFALSRLTVPKEHFATFFIALALALSLLYAYTWEFIILCQITFFISIFFKRAK